MQVNRSTHYYQAVPALDEMLLANEIHELWLEFPYYGYRRITAELQRRKHNINHKRVIRMMREMRLQALYPKPKTTLRNPDHKIYPYLLQGLKIMRPNQVWATDITYIRMPNGFMYLVALIDLFSRYIIEWNFSNTLSTDFCGEMLQRAFTRSKPDIVNTDQGCQFTSNTWTSLVIGNNVRVSMDGRGRWADNIYIERFWRTLKHEHIFLHAFETVNQAKSSIERFIDIYNHKRLHQSLGYQTPSEVYYI